MYVHLVDLKLLFPSMMACVLAIESFSLTSGLELESFPRHLIEHDCFPILLFLTLKVVEQTRQVFSMKSVLDAKVFATFLFISSLTFEVAKDRLQLELQNLPLA
jgi:hypothetical protein